jgi:hypothetical protein
LLFASEARSTRAKRDRNWLGDDSAMVVKVSASDIAGYALAGAARKVEAGWRKRNKLNKQLRPIKGRHRKRRKRKCAC